MKNKTKLINNAKFNNKKLLDDLSIGSNKRNTAIQNYKTRPLSRPNNLTIDYTDKKPPYKPKRNITEQYGQQTLTYDQNDNQMSYKEYEASYEDKSHEYLHKNTLDNSIRPETKQKPGSRLKNTLNINNHNNDIPSENLNYFRTSNNKPTHLTHIDFYVDPKKNESVGKPKKLIELSHNSNINNKLGNSALTADKNKKKTKKFITKDRIQIKSHIRKPSSSSKANDVGFQKDTSLINPLSLNLDSSQATQVTNHFKETDTLATKTADSSIKHDFRDLKTPPLEYPDKRTQLEIIKEDSEVKIPDSGRKNKLRESIRYGNKNSDPNDEYHIMGSNHYPRGDFNNGQKDHHENRLLVLETDLNYSSQEEDEKGDFGQILAIHNTKKRNSQATNYDKISTEIKQKQSKKEQNNYFSKEIKAQNDNNYSKETAFTGNLKSMTETNFNKRKPVESSEMTEWDEDFMSRPRNPKNSSNLLKLVSNEELSNISNTIMNDLKKGNKSSNNLMNINGQSCEEEKHIDDTNHVIDEQDDEEDEIINFTANIDQNAFTKIQNLEMSNEKVNNRYAGIYDNDQSEYSDDDIVML